MGALCGGCVCASRLPRTQLSSCLALPLCPESWAAGMGRPQLTSGHGSTESGTINQSAELTYTHNKKYTSWHIYTSLKNNCSGNFLVVQGLGLCALTAKSPGSTPGQGTEIPHHSQKKNCSRVFLPVWHRPPSATTIHRPSFPVKPLHSPGTERQGQREHLRGLPEIPSGITKLTAL